MIVHELKTHPAPFAQVAAGRKRFEVRENDRGFVVGHVLTLREWDPDTEAYSGRRCIVRVTYIALGPIFGIEAGHCIMSIEPLTPQDILDTGLASYADFGVSSE